MSREFAADRPQNVVRKLAAIAVEGGNDADGELSPHLIGQGTDGGNLPLGAPESKEAGFHRHECLVSGAQCIEGQVADGGRAVDDASVKVWRHAFEVSQETPVAVGKRNQTAARAFQASQRHRAWRQAQSTRHFPKPSERVAATRRLTQERLRQTEFDTCVRNAKSRGAVALRIHVNQQDSLAPLCQRGGKVDGGGGLAGPALLINDGYCSHPRIRVQRPHPCGKRLSEVDRRFGEGCLILDAAISGRSAGAHRAPGRIERGIGNIAHHPHITKAERHHQSERTALFLFVGAHGLGEGGHGTG